MSTMYGSGTTNELEKLDVRYNTALVPFFDKKANTTHVK